ncbi:Endoribonuclease YbeY [Rosistilla oblonga]|uniref:Endoribonuclease YbeY n=1 Tax=Rosistilla oblonga TaxID=2527990 RepID=A0A518J0C0_9BACT|nr:rRNA maturation RNase YbeY [Rosistilla oblonga]QDV13038.1 Endoribonuclease YbeY [Rosistilla oblonga]QDV58793.1 Endoribonuclease YbeY [Rosistilla oblonga]
MSDDLAVEINVQHEASFIDRPALESAVRLVAETYGICRGEVSIAIVDDDNMQRLNNQFLQHDYTTDCLSFVYDESEDSISGELILCADYAQREAAEFEWQPESELLLYAVHGMLHLMGMEDTTDEGRQAMRDEEREILLRLGIEGAKRHGLPTNSNPSEKC